MKKLIHTHPILIILIILIILYQFGCKDQISEPNQTNIGEQIIKKETPTIQITLEKRKLLLEKFFKEVKEARIKVKEKWYQKKRDQALFKTADMAPADQEAVDLANSITPSAYSFIYSAYGVDLNQYFPQDDPNIALTGLLVAYVESDLNNGIRYEVDGELIFNISEGSEFSKGISTGLNKTSSLLLRPKWVDCMAEAAGVAAFVDLLYAGGAATLTVTGVIKLAGKVLAKHLTYIGAAVALADFIWCMYD